MAPCKSIDCSVKQKYLSLGYCHKHYHLFKRYGDSQKNRMTGREAIMEKDVAKIPLGKNAKHGYALVDKKFSYLDKYAWSLKTGYATTTIRRKGVLMHRLIMHPSIIEQIDHKNGLKLDNRTRNLRICTDNQNKYNTGKYKNNTTGFKGVEFMPKSGRYRTRLRVDKKAIHIGCFQTAIDAARAYDIAAMKMHGEFARINNV